MEVHEEMSYPVLEHISLLGDKELSALALKESIRYRSFSMSHVRIERSGADVHHDKDMKQSDSNDDDDDDRRFCVHKRRRTEQGIMTNDLEDANKSALVIRPVPVMLTAPGAVAEGVYRQYLWLCRSNRSPAEIANRLESDRKIGVYPCLAAINAIIRSLFALSNVNGVLDMLEELIVAFPHTHGAPDDNKTSSPAASLITGDALLLGGGAATAAPTSRSPIDPSTYRLILDGLCDLKCYVKAAHVALYADATVFSRVSQTSPVAITLWYRIIDGLLDSSTAVGGSAAAVPTGSLGTDEAGISFSNRILIAQDCIRRMAPAQHIHQILGERRSLRLLECVLLQNNKGEFSLNEVVDQFFLASRCASESALHHGSMNFSETPRVLLGRILSTFASFVARKCVNEADQVRLGSMFKSSIPSVIRWCVQSRAKLSPQAYSDVLAALVHGHIADDKLFASVWMLFLHDALPHSVSDGNAEGEEDRGRCWEVDYIDAFPMCLHSFIMRLIASDGTVAHWLERHFALPTSRQREQPEAAASVLTPPPFTISHLLQQVCLGFNHGGCSRSSLDKFVECMAVLSIWAARHNLGQLLVDSLGGSLLSYSTAGGAEHRETLMKHFVAHFNHPTKKQQDEEEERPSSSALTFTTGFDVLLTISLLEAEYSQGTVGRHKTVNSSTNGCPPMLLHPPASLVPHSVEHSLRGMITTGDTYVTVLDSASIAAVSESEARVEAFCSMMRKYDVTCGCRLIVPFASLYLASSLDAAKKTRVAWIATLLRQRARWVCLLPCSSSIHDLSRFESAGLLDEKASVMYVIKLIKQDLAHAKTLLVAGSSDIREACAARDVKPVVAIADLLKKLNCV